MSKLLFFIFMISVIFISCDGSHRADKSSIEVLKTNHLFKSFSKQVNFIPNQPIEISTDTVLSNGFQIKLNYHSLENSFVLKSKASKNDSIIDTNYKNFEANFQIFKNEKLLIKETLSKSMFSEYETSKFWEDAIMQFVWIDYENSLDNFITLNTAFHIPETDIYKDFCIQINQFGIMKIRAVNLAKKVS